MKVDRQTFRDLDVTPGSRRTGDLLTYLDRTSTQGGARLWKERLAHPLRSLEETRDVQDALRFILSHEQLFAGLPTDREIHAVDRYLHSNFATISSTVSPARWIEAIWVRFRYPAWYWAASEGAMALGIVWQRMSRLAEGLEGAPELLARVSVEIESFADSETPGELFEYIERGGSGLWSRAPAMDRLAREEMRRSLVRLLDLVYELDALRSMATVSKELGLCFPELQADSGGMEVRGMWHPFIESPVANDVSFTPADRLMFLTGPNMAGKTTYLKACGIVVLLAHVGMGVPARACRLPFLDRLVCAIRTEDSVRHGISYFQAEARRVQNVAEWITRDERSVVLVDELFRGTNVKDAADATEAVIRGFTRASSSHFMISSHLIEVAARIEALPGMLFQQFEAGVEGGNLTFSYRATEGISDQRLGMEVLREQGVLEALDGIGTS
jgi:DNA mismatch repair protein MutS